MFSSPLKFPTLTMRTPRVLLLRHIRRHLARDNARLHRYLSLSPVDMEKPAGLRPHARTTPVASQRQPPRARVASWRPSASVQNTRSDARESVRGSTTARPSSNPRGASKQARPPQRTAGRACPPAAEALAPSTHRTSRETRKRTVGAWALGTRRALWECAGAPLLADTPVCFPSTVRRHSGPVLRWLDRSM